MPCLGLQELMHGVPCVCETLCSKLDLTCKVYNSQHNRTASDSMLRCKNSVCEVGLEPHGSRRWLVLA